MPTLFCLALGRGEYCYLAFEGIFLRKWVSLTIQFFRLTRRAIDVLRLLDSNERILCGRSVLIRGRKK